MALKKEQHFFKGLQRDLSVSKFDSGYAFDAQNIRITARDNNTLLTVTNERGNKEIPLQSPSGATVVVDGTLIGHNVLNHYITLFTKGTNDNIYRLESKGTYFEAILLFSGNLNFNTDYPIESIGIYENIDIQKIYWIDGLNQNRVINIVASNEVKNNWDNLSFDFVQGLALKEIINIKRSDFGGGAFSSGVIQYAFSYYNLYGQESNIFYTSPLNYVSFVDRGASPEDKVSITFEITLENLDTRFEYVRIYSIHRASIDATPNVVNIADLAINDNTPITYIDNGIGGTNIDPTELLFIGGEEVVFQTMTHKDNTLFLGNAKIKRELVSPNIIDSVKNGTILFENKNLNYSLNNSGLYPYKNTLYLGSSIKTFKSREWYRFGLQFQAKNGKWSEPIWINDSYNSSVKPSYDGNLSLVQAKYSINSNVINIAIQQGFEKVRGVVVYPTISDREAVVQGMLCPTVFNVGDRYDNSPFVQSSWFSRPNLSIDIENNKVNGNIVGGGTNALNAMYAIVSNTTQGGVDVVNQGAWAEFRHHYPIPNNYERGAEIQCIANTWQWPYTYQIGGELSSFVRDNAEYFFIDQSVLTLHSPDIEFDTQIQNITNNNLKLRIVGVIPMTSNTGDIDLSTSTPPNNERQLGFYKESVGNLNKSYHGFRSLISGVYWYDVLSNTKEGPTKDNWKTGFITYAWHRNGSLNNEGAATEDIPIRTALLAKKKISNLKFSAYSHFFDEPWYAYIEGDNYHKGITPISIFNSNEQSLIKIPSPENSGLPPLTYYGNVDKVLVPTRGDIPYTIGTTAFNKKDGYPIVSAHYDTWDIHKVFNGNFEPTKVIESGGEPASTVNTGSDPVSIKYKSTPHIVFAFNYTFEGEQVVAPTNLEIDYGLPYKVNIGNGGGPGFHPFWDPKAKEVGSPAPTFNGIYQDAVAEYTFLLPNKSVYGYLFLGELYNDNVQNRFGGQTLEAFESNMWLPAGDSYRLKDINGVALTNLDIYYIEGDTFFQRYDCLKTYPYTLEDQNSVIDIVSFMCETRVNIDGRYDRNRGQYSNLNVTPTNFNMMNSVYNQADNFFNYRGINYNRLNINYFPNIITWTKEKQLGSVIDTWTNITMASTLDLDGDKGEVVSLNTFRNEIFAFQRRGLSNILFNSRVQIPTSDGMPIEITNGLKVSGKRYINNTIGCSNKWSITESPSGLYFVDNETNSIYLFNGEITSLSDKLGFRQWINTHNTYMNWEPVGYNNYRSFYDKNNNDVYFTYKDYCLCYSELINQFTSFMSYERVPAMFNMSSNFYAFKNGKMWEQFSGDYNMFFGEYKPFSITFVANAEALNDKIFNTVEFRADSWDGDNLISNKTFDTLDVWNEYQHGTISLTNTLGHPSPLKKKFRIWRANIPRAVVNNRDRIRNTWAYIKLGMNTPNTYRTEFHDAIIHYFT